MPDSPLDRLQAAGFSPDEIGQWSTQQRQTLGAAGFSGEEIDNYLAGPEPGIGGFLHRVDKAIDPLRVITQAGKDFWEGFKEGGGLEPALSPEERESYSKMGLLYVAQPIAAAGKVSTAILHGLANAVPPIGGPLLAGTEAFPAGHLTGLPVPYAPIMRAVPDVDGNITHEAIGDLPTRQDFADAATTVAGSKEASPAFRAKLEQLWEQNGIHPAEVANDAQKDVTISQQLASSTGELPSAYVGRDQPPEKGVTPPEPETPFPVSPPGQPQLKSFSPDQLRVDAQRFQLKEGTDAIGVSPRLQDVKQWDPLKAGLGIAFEDNDGETYIVDGHQRLALANRIGSADPTQEPMLNAWVLRAADGVTDQDARAIAAAKNIAEGTGTPADAAKVLRDRPDLLPTLPPRSELVRQAQGLMKLDPEAFGKIINDVVPANYGAIVGRLVPDDPVMQNAMVDLLAKVKPDNVTQAESVVRQGIDAGLHTETQATLFGDQDVVSSLYGERARILDRSLRNLKQDRIVFQRLVDNHAIIEELGNELAQDENLRRAAIDGQASQILQTLANRRGPISDALTRAARGVADGVYDRSRATQDFVAELRRQAASGDLARLAHGGGGGDLAITREGTRIPPAATTDPGARVLTPAEQQRANAQVDFALEKTEQGQQYVIPGAEASARQAAAARGEKIGPGAAAQQPPGGLFAPKETPEEELPYFLPPKGGGPPVGMSIGWPEEEPPERTPAEQTILDRISISQGRDKRPMTWGRLYTATIDKLFPIAQATARAVGEGTRAALGGINSIATADNPYQLARLLSGVAGKADHWLNYASIDFNTYENTGPSLKAILEPVKEDLDGFRAFAASVRSLELEARGIETGLNLGAAREVAQAGIEKYAGPLEQLIDYQDRLALYLKDSGILSAEGYAAMKEANRLYVPFNRVFTGEERGRGFGGATLQARNPIHRIEGSEREIIDPIESIIRNTYTYVAMAERNAVGTKLVDLLREGSDAHGAIGDVSDIHARDAVSNPATVYADTPVRDVDGSVLPPVPVQPDLFPGRGPIAKGAESALKPGTPMPTDIAEAIRNVLKAQGLSDELFDFVAQGAPASEGEIGVFRNGARETWTVDPELAASMKALDRQSVGMIEGLLAKPASWLRAGAVLTPDFQLRHTFRDYIYAAMTGKGFFSPVDMARGFIGLVTKDEDFQNWLKSGGANISRVALDRRYLQESLQRLNGETGLMTRAWNVVADPDALYREKAGAIAGLPFRAADKFILNPLRMVTELAENASHLGAFKKALRAGEAEMPEGGPLTKELIQSAGFQSRDVAVDAARIGAQTRAYNMITAFANITLQDTDRVGRAFVTNPLGTTLKIAGGIMLPSALLWWANHDDPRYQELPQWEKDLFWIVMTKDHIFRIPKPWGMGVLFGSGTERALEAFAAGRPDPLKEFGKSIADTVVPQFYPTAAAPILDQFANRSAFTNRTLVPSQLEGQLPEYQYTPYTTEAAKKLSQIIAAFPGVREESLDQSSPLVGGVARALTTPILLENYIRGWTGNLGIYALDVMDASLRRSGLAPDPPRPTDTLADMPVVKAFAVRYPSASAQSIQDFYDEYQRDKTYFDTWKARASEGDTEAMAKIQSAGGPRMFLQMDAIARTLSEHSQLIRDVWKDPSIQPDEKRQLIDQLYFSEISIAKDANIMMRQSLGALH